MVAIPRGTHLETDVVTAFTEWVAAAELQSGDPLFQRVRRGATKPTGQRLGAHSVALILAKYTRPADAMRDTSAAVLGL